MQFNSRTAKTIENLFDRYGLKPIYLRVLHAIYKHAWHERHPVTATGMSFLHKSRTFRDRMWWEVSKLKPDYAKKRQENWLHACGGILLIGKVCFAIISGLIGGYSETPVNHRQTG